MSKSKKIKLISAIATILIVAGLLFFMFSGDNFQIVKSLFNDNLTEEEFKSLLQSFGWRGAVTLGILSMLQVVLTFLPAEPVQVLSGIGYGFGYGFLICLAGVIVGNTLIYVMYKILGSKLNNYFAKNVDIDFDSIKTSNRIALIVFILYFLPAIPYGIICIFSASVGMKYPRYILVTVLGSIPSIIIGVGMGHIAIASSWILSLAVFGVLLILIVILFIKRKAVFKKVNLFIAKQNKKSNAKTVKKVSKFYMSIAGIVVKVLRRKVNFKYVKKDEITSPAIVLCSHGSFLDFVYALTMIKDKDPHFIMARLYFYRKLFNKVLRKGGCIPKSMYTADIENAKNCLKVIGDGEVLAMMPEAHLSTAGKFEGVHRSTLKFIQKMGVDIYGIRICGSYFAKPKWGDSIRKGAPVEAELSKIITAEELKTLTLCELHEKIEKSIGFDDFKWLEEKYPDYNYNHKTLAVGLENILYKCPVCGKEFTMKTEGMQVYCTECSHKLTLDNRYAFTDQSLFKNYAEWYDWQVQKLREEIACNPDYVLEATVTLKMASKKGNKLVEPVGVGVCRLNRSGLAYEGEIDGKKVAKHFPIESMIMLLYGAGEDFEIYEKDQIYYFVPSELKSCIKWHIASLILKEEN